MIVRHAELATAAVDSAVDTPADVGDGAHGWGPEGGQTEQLEQSRDRSQPRGSSGNVAQRTAFSERSVDPPRVLGCEGECCQALS